MKIRKCKCGVDILLEDETYDLLDGCNIICRVQSGKVLGLYVGNPQKNLARFVISVEDGEEPDHIDGNVHNNLKSNLRSVTRQENRWNSIRRKDGSSIYKGVSWKWQRNKWLAQIEVGGRNVYLGLFKSEEKAAVAYNNAAIEHFGEHARLNVLPWPNSVFQGPPKQSDIPLSMMQITP